MTAGDKSNTQQDIDAAPAVKKAVHIAVGAIVVMLLIVGIFWGWTRTHDNPMAVEPSLEDRIGVVDMQHLIKSHSDYAELKSLEEEIRVLEADVALDHMTMMFQPPEPDHEAFAEAARQKQNFEEVAHYTQLADEVKAKVKKMREDKAEEYELEIKQAEEQFLNEILSLKLQLDNAEVMHLTRDEAQQKNDRLADLQQKRKSAVQSIINSHEYEIKAYAERLIAEANAKQAKFTQELDEKYKVEELRKETEALNRNTQMMDQGAVTPMENAVRKAQKKAEIAAKKQKYKMLKQHIYTDISGLASKLAIMNHLTLIISNTVDNQKGQEYYAYNIGDWTELRSPIIGINTIDLTEEMLKEMTVSRMTAESSSDSSTDGKEEK